LFSREAQPSAITGDFRKWDRTRAFPSTRHFEIYNFQFAIFNNWSRRDELAYSANVLQIENCKFQIAN
jgi:hypothetical protein